MGESFPYKQRGFTLIELLVVIAIIWPYVETAFGVGYEDL